MIREETADIVLWVERYLAEEQLRTAKKRKTVAYERSCLKHLIRFCRDGRWTGKERIDWQQFWEYLGAGVSEKTGRPLRASTRKNILDQAIRFVDWYRRQNGQPLEQLQMGALDGQKKEYRTQPLSDFVLAQIVAALHTETDRALAVGIVMLLCTGISLREFVELGADCLDRQSGSYILDTGKRRLMIPESLAPALRRQQELQKKLQVSALAQDAGRLWLYRSRGQVCCLSVPMWEYKLRQFVRNYQITDETGALAGLTAQMLRATCVYQMVAQKMPLPVIRYLLGHRNIESTRRQVERFEKQLALAGAKWDCDPVREEGA